MEWIVNLKQKIKNKSITVGVIGLGHIGERVAKLCQGLGMSVSAYNRTPTRMEFVHRRNLDEILHNSDVILLHLALNEETKGFLSEEKINKIKEGAIVINTANRLLVNERDMANSLKMGRIDQYCFEADSVNGSPLKDIETAIAFKPFGWYTKEALNRNKEIWVKNIAGLCREQPTNRIAL